MSNKFYANLEIGQVRETVIVNFLNKHYGYILIGGEYNGDIVGISEIEEYSDSCFKWSSLGVPQLCFERNGDILILTMPDLLLSKNGKSFWNEIKSSRKVRNSIDIPCDSFRDYTRVWENSGFPLYVTLVIPTNDDTWNIYTAEIRVLINENLNVVYNSKYGSDVFRFSISLFKKINKHPIKLEDYL